MPPILLLRGRNGAPKGYYVLAIGYDNDNLYLEDPFRVGSISYIPIVKLNQIWNNKSAGQ